MVQLYCVVEHITYQNAETGYCVLQVSARGETESVTAVGNFGEVFVGTVLLLEGEWKNDARFGRQFSVRHWEETMPATLYGIQKYLGSGLIKGIGKKYAGKIVSAFGTDTISVIEEEPQRLKEVPGIGEKRIRRISESWEKQKEIKNIMIFLQSNDVSTAYAAKIYKTYGNESISVVRENPFRLADDIWGIGFKTADRIAAKLGYEPQGYERCRSGIRFTLNELASEGNVYALKDQLVKKGMELLDIPEAVLSSVVDTMTESGELIRDREAIYLPSFYYAECGVASRLLELSCFPEGKEKEISFDEEAISRVTGIRFDSIQLSAIRVAASSKLMILTGGPGTGKTTSTRGIIAMLRSAGMRVLLAAPTGRAAKRMTESTGLEAKTIHRLLEFKPPEGYQRNENSPLEGDVLIVDECSMVDLLLMNALLKAIPPAMRLVLIGDVDQLPSVGCGNVLMDIIESGSFPVVKLTRIFRQAQNSRIITNAHRINKGSFPEISNNRNSDFFFLEEEDAEKAAKTIVDLVKRRLPKSYGINPNQIQVLTPMQRGAVGAANLNILLQDAINRHDISLRRSGCDYRLLDKVMQIRNNYEKEVFNGDIGIITAVNAEERELSVTFDGRTVMYDQTELDELVLAYACTIHKSQGSEYPVVVMPVMMTHFVMLQRNLLYTGITRAKKLLVIIGSKKALSYAVRNQTVSSRNSFLKERLHRMEAAG